MTTKGPQPIKVPRFACKPGALLFIPQLSKVLQVQLLTLGKVDKFKYRLRLEPRLLG